MTREPKLLFDECLGRPAVEHIARLLDLEQQDKRPAVAHLLDIIQAEGVWDEDWIPRIAGEQWTIITGDRGRKGGRKKGEKLARVCAIHNVTHVVLSRRVNTRKVFDKMLTVLSVWPELIEIATGELGKRFAIEPLSSHPSSRCKGKIVERPYPPGYIHPNPLPGELFPP